MDSEVTGVLPGFRVDWKIDWKTANRVSKSLVVRRIDCRQKIKSDKINVQINDNLSNVEIYRH